MKNIQTAKIKYFNKDLEKLGYIAGKSDWIDLRVSEAISIKKGEFKKIRLGIAIELPEGYEAFVIPRGSLFQKTGLLQTNSVGLIDETFCGDNDEWLYPVLTTEDVELEVNERICQFRIIEHQPLLIFEEVETLENEDRGKFGSTGTGIE